MMDWSPRSRAFDPSSISGAADGGHTPRVVSGELSISNPRDRSRRECCARLACLKRIRDVRRAGHPRRGDARYGDGPPHGFACRRILARPNVTGHIVHRPRRIHKGKERGFEASKQAGDHRRLRWRRCARSPVSAGVSRDG